jgi:hypothetical protein
LRGLALKLPESQSHFVLIDAAASMAPDVAPSRSTSTTERDGAIFEKWLGIDRAMFEKCHERKISFSRLFCSEEVDQPIHRHKR